MTHTIKLDNISLTYPNGYTALQNINATLQSGRIYGLLGINGAGKSTLFKSVMNFVTPTSGKVFINNQNVRTALKSNLIAYVSQTEEVDWNFPVLVEDVVMMGRYGHMGFLRNPKQADYDAVNTALERVDMQDFRKRQIGELSGGQKKRVFVARALAQGGKIILLDEPFTGVDIKTENALISLFKNLASQNHLILVSTHNLANVPNFCDEVLLINKTLLAHGDTNTTFTPENLAKTFGGALHQRPNFFKAAL